MSELFLRRQVEPVQGYPLLTILRSYLKPTKGAVGIEVEVEGNKFPKINGYETTHKAMPIPGWNYWSYVKDGSLRGQDNAEYVLQKPIEFEQVPEAVKELSDKLTAYGSVLAESNRTSVHVHLNCQSFHMNRLASFCALYFCFEEVLTEWCGDHRVGNLFCLRGRDAPGIVTALRRFIQNDGSAELSDGLHYSGLNANALTKFGSLEVRSLRGPTDLSIIVDWVSILERLYKLSAEFKDPRDIPAQFSAQGPLTFFETILGEAGFTLRAGIDFDDERIRDSMYDGIRIAQDLCYCRDWDNFVPVEVVEDPFGRVKPKKSWSSLSEALDHFDHLTQTTAPLQGPNPFYASAYSSVAPLPEVTVEATPEEDDEDEDEDDDLDDIHLFYSEDEGI